MPSGTLDPRDERRTSSPTPQPDMAGAYIQLINSATHFEKQGVPSFYDRAR